MVAISLALVAEIPARAETFELGGMYTYHYRDGRYADWGDYALHGARIAIDEVNASGLLGDDRLVMRPENTIDYHCWPENAALMAETLMRKDILVLTGADCSGPAVEIARVAERFGVPVISNGANASALSSKDEFPWFVRVVSPSEAYEGYLVEVAAQFGVRELAHLHTTDAWGLGARDVIDEYAARHGIEIGRRFGYPRDTDQAVIEGHLAEIRAAGIRHIAMTGPTPDTVRFFSAVGKLGMNLSGYSYYAAEMVSADEGDAAVLGGLGYFAPMVALQPSTVLAEFTAALEARLGGKADPSSKAFFYGALSYDHVLAVAHAIKSLKDDEMAVNRNNMMAALRAVDFEGATGRIRIDPDSNDRADNAIQIVNNHGFKTVDGERSVDFVSVGVVDALTGVLTLDASRIVWPGGVRTPPAPDQSDPEP